MYINPSDISEVKLIHKDHVTEFYNAKILDLYQSIPSNTPCQFEDFNGTFSEFLIAYKIPVEDFYTLQQEKNKLISILNEKLDSTKIIDIKNGNSLVLSKADNEWKYFCDIIEIAYHQVGMIKNETSYEYTANSFNVQNLFVIKSDENAKYSVKMQNFFWKKIFGEYQENRVKNAEIYQTTFAKINKISSLDALSLISFEFIGEGGIVIDVNQKIEELKLEAQEGKLPQDAILALQGAIDPEGNVHLIQKEQLF